MVVPISNKILFFVIVKAKFDQTMTVTAVATAAGNAMFKNYLATYKLFYGASESGIAPYPDLVNGKTEKV